MTTDGGHDPANYDGFTQFYLEILDRFRDVAVDNHTGSSGNLSMINEHIRGITDPETLLSQYEFPVLMSYPTTTTPVKATVASDRGEINMQVVAWTANYEQVTALEDAIIIAGNVVNNVENDRELVNGTGRAAATDIDVQEFAPDFMLQTGQTNAFLKFCQVTFNVEYKRRQPR